MDVANFHEISDLLSRREVAASALGRMLVTRAAELLVMLKKTALGSNYELFDTAFNELEGKSEFVNMLSARLKKFAADVKEYAGTVGE
jgi:hypothetical protein